METWAVVYKIDEALEWTDVVHIEKGLRTESIGQSRGPLENSTTFVVHREAPSLIQAATSVDNDIRRLLPTVEPSEIQVQRAWRTNV